MVIVILLLFPLIAVIMFFLGILMKEKRKLFFILGAISLAGALLTYYSFTTLLRVYGVDYINFQQ
jgi:hypothetical protein